MSQTTLFWTSRIKDWFKIVKSWKMARKKIMRKIFKTFSICEWKFQQFFFLICYNFLKKRKTFYIQKYIKKKIWGDEQLSIGGNTPYNLIVSFWSNADWSDQNSLLTTREVAQRGQDIRYCMPFLSELWIDLCVNRMIICFFMKAILVWCLVYINQQQKQLWEYIYHNTSSDNQLMWRKSPSL